MIPLITGLFSIGKQWMENKKEVKQAKHKIKIAGMENRARLLRDKQSNNHDWEMKVLEGKDSLLQRFSFLMFSLPFIVAMFDHEKVKDYFDVGLSSMPDWYIQIFVSIIGGVWGFAALKDSIPNIVTALKRKK